MNEHIYLYFWSKKISIWVEQEEVKKYLLQLTHISGIPVEAQISPPHSSESLENPTLHITVSGNPKLEFLEDSQVLNLAIDWNVIKNKNSSLSNIIGQLISLACVNWGEFPLHSSVVANNGKASLILGSSGAGKTNLSIALCKEKNFRWLANDWCTLTLDGHNVLVSQGYDLINFRLASLNQIAHCLPKSLLKQMDTGEKDVLDYSIKSRFFSSDEIEIQKANMPLPISHIYFIQISPNQQNMFLKLNSGEAIEVLAREFFWPLRGLGSFLVDNSNQIVSPSVAMRPLAGWEVMCKIINVLANGYPAYYINSNLDTAIQSILNTNQ